MKNITVSSCQDCPHFFTGYFANISNVPRCHQNLQSPLPYRLHNDGFKTKALPTYVIPINCPLKDAPEHCKIIKEDVKDDAKEFQWTDTLALVYVVTTAVAVIGFLALKHKFLAGLWTGIV